MAFDRFVNWGSERPSREDVGQVCEDFVKGLGSVEWNGPQSRYYIHLAGTYSSPQTRAKGGLYAKPLPEAGFVDRYIEVWIGEDCIDIMTRHQDDVTNTIAEGLAKVFARFWKGSLDQG